MGSSDPLPAGFEIRFGSMNFQAMGNSYLMRITNRAELHPWQSTRTGRFPLRLLPTPQRPRQRTLWALQHPDVDSVLASARARHEWNDVGPRAPRHNTTRPSARRRRRPQGSA
jgi:hypothetical protein